VYKKFITNVGSEKAEMIMIKSPLKTRNFEKLKATTRIDIANLFVHEDLKSFSTYALRKFVRGKDLHVESAFLQHVALSAPNLDTFEDPSNAYCYEDNMAPFLLEGYLNIFLMKNLKNLTLSGIHKGDLTLISCNLPQLESLDVKFLEQVNLTGKKLFEKYIFKICTLEGYKTGIIKSCSSSNVVGHMAIVEIMTNSEVLRDMNIDHFAKYLKISPDTPFTNEIRLCKIQIYTNFF
jgi:hypothetical protein